MKILERLALWKAYFDKGYGIINYAKFFIVIMSAASINNDLGITVVKTIIFAILYGLSCFFLGWWAFRYGFAKEEIEVQNRINPFVVEVRKSLNNRTASK